MIRTLIVDDQSSNIETLKLLLNKYCPAAELIGTAQGATKAYELITTLRPDLVLLDIEMPDGSGFDLLRSINPISFEVIFITAYDQYAVQAFRENALDYLLKPIDGMLLSQTIEKAVRQIRMKAASNENLLRYLNQLRVATPQKVGLPTQEGYLFADPADIIRCQGSGSYSKICFKDGQQLLVSKHLKECEKILPDNFCRVHNSHIVNLQYVARYIRGKTPSLVLTDGSEIDVSPDRKEMLLERLMQNSGK